MRNKGFTLIELLVVVAIIGILAAVGVVAYSGYTSSAKKQAAKSNHQSLIKYFSAELQKCNLGNTKFIENSINCSDRFTNYKISQFWGFQKRWCWKGREWMEVRSYFLMRYLERFGAMRCARR